MITDILFVGVGGMIGSILRYLLSSYAQEISRSIDFPYGTLVVNLIGCFIIGLLSQLAESGGVFTNESRLFVFTGMLGGFTTFSSFGDATINLARDGRMMSAFANVGIHIIAGLGMVLIGRAVAFWIWR